MIQFVNTLNNFLMRGIPFLLIVFLCSTINSYSQTVSSSCNLNDTIAPLYKNDADRLAVRRAFKTNSNYKDSVSISSQVSDNYLRALIAVYNATAIPQRDTVIKKCQIHTVHKPQLNDFAIGADSNLIWLKNIRYNISPTGNATIDNAISKYSLQKTQFNAYAFSKNHYASFNAGFNINTTALGVQIGTVTGVIFSGPNAVAWDGSDIKDSINPNFILLTYSYEWGDCIVGCLFGRYWQFKVHNDCSVEYIGTFGNAPLPVDVGINENQKNRSSVRVYPIPAKNEITIESLESIIKSYSIYNTIGQKISQNNTSDLKIDIDINSLDQGVYFIIVNTQTGQRTVKFIKS